MARANNREEFPVALNYSWKTFSGELFLQQVLHGLRVHAFVVMPNHFHMLATSPFRDVDLIMRDFISASTRILNVKSRHSGRIFGGRYNWSLVSNPYYYAHVLKYVIRNPVKAGLAAKAGDYPFSTYSGEIGTVRLPLAISEPDETLGSLVPKDFEARDLWLNEPHPSELNRAIRTGLRSKEFKVFPDPEKRRKHDLTI